MDFEYNDGGRQAAGYRGSAGDCVTRAIAIAMELPYQHVYDAMATGNASQRASRGTRYNHAKARRQGGATAAQGINTTRKWFKDWMTARGWRWVATMGIGTGCKVHLRADELPAGRLIVAVSTHYVAIVDGVIHDTFDPSRNGTRCVYGYWKKKGAPA